MNAGPTSIRIYDALVNQLRKRGHKPGTRLDPVLIANELGTSPTPVRDALHILAGEELVVALPNGGFTTPNFDEQSLSDLYRWNGDVLIAALRCQEPQGSSPAPEEIKDRDNVDLADRIAAMFQWIADGSSNSEHARAQARINARLRNARLAEMPVVKEGDADLNPMVLYFGLNMFSDVRRLVERYTIRRKRLVGKIIMNMHRSPLK